MKKLVVVVLAIAVAAMFAMPVMAANSGCGKPDCKTCAKPSPCPTCGKPCNILQSTANVINKMEAPPLPCGNCGKPDCGACSKPKPCPTCGQPCNVLQSAADAISSMQAPCPCPKPCNKCNK